MKLIKFESDTEYTRAQRRTVRRRGRWPFFTDLEIKRICDWMTQNRISVRKGICHGARNGWEADEFKYHFPHSDVFGTDLFPYSSKRGVTHSYSDVVRWDFSKPKEEWCQSFDFVYSNSLDHARDPQETVALWLSQLRRDGFLFIQWSKGHTRVSGGDCFGADLFEVIDLINKVGRVQDLLYVCVDKQMGNPLRYKALETVVVVVGQKPPIRKRRRRRGRRRNS